MKIQLERCIVPRGYEHEKLQALEEVPQAWARGETLSVAKFPDCFLTIRNPPTRKIRASRLRMTASVIIAPMTSATAVEIPLPLSLPRFQPAKQKPKI